ncbi:MAG: DUF2608 domain-containing protein [Parachlamydiales bacterium]|nr:DUF2608 domain-containing protein [Parachlamydiales bacterium]
MLLGNILAIDAPYIKSIEIPFITAQDLSVVKEVLERADADTLVLWDVDQTLIVPDDPILRPKWEQLLDHLIGGKVIIDAEGKKRYIFREILTNAAHSVLDAGSVSLIDELQGKGVSVIAFTAAPGGKIGKIDSFVDWRIEELEKFGFQFGLGLSADKIELPKDPELEFPPVYKSGVLITSLHDKGPVLLDFLQALDWTPRQIIFIDDQMSNLKSVSQSLKGKTRFVGIHYTAASKLMSDLDIEKAKEQVEHFIQTGEWITSSD